MALFQKAIKHSFRSERRFQGMNPAGRAGLPLPGFMKHLSVSCPGHAHGGLQYAMKFIGQTRGRYGDPIAIYACPLCNWRAGYVFNSLTGGTKCLWAGFGDGR